MTALCPPMVTYPVERRYRPLAPGALGRRVVAFEALVVVAAQELIFVDVTRELSVHLMLAHFAPEALWVPLVRAAVDIDQVRGFS